MRNGSAPHARYDRLAKRYDRWESSIDRLMRRLSAEQLQLHAGDVVLVPGCGTARDLPPLVEAVGPTGRVIGLDYSKEMLRLARARVTRNGWSNVVLIYEDARLLSADLLDEYTSVRAVDGVLFSNILSIVPDWEDVFTRGYALLREHRRCAVHDIRPAAGVARILNPLLAAFWRLGAADLSRPVGPVVEACMINPHVFKTRTQFLCAGTKSVASASSQSLPTNDASHGQPEDATTRRLCLP